jgi:thiol-disulfide isomerase/thioredoxin
MDKKIIFLSLKGCHQCEQYKPVFDRVIKELNLPFEYYVLPDAPIDLKKLLYKNNIQTFPTVLTIAGGNVAKLEGAKLESKLKEFLLA